MSLNINFRKAQLEDAKNLVGFVNGVYRGEKALKSWTTEAGFIGGIRTDIERMVKTLNSPTEAILVGESKNTKELSCCVHLENNKTYAYLGMLTVSLDLQNSGLGRKVLAEAEKFTQEEWRIHEIRMGVLANRTELLEWYLRRGYSDSGHRKPWPYDDPGYGLTQVPGLEFIILSKKLEFNK